MTEYNEKLKDPRWQKRRVKVFERDDWCCVWCQDNSSTLHVHHYYYEKGKEPWDYPLEAFLTLCEKCHGEERNWREKEEKFLIKTLRKKGFHHYNIHEITDAFMSLELPYPNDVCVSVIKWVFSRPVFKETCEAYFARIAKGI